MINLNLPINSVSFGQVSTGLLRDLYKRKKEILLAPLHDLDLASQKEDLDFKKWIEEAAARFPIEYNRENKIFRLWHLNGSLSSFAEEQVLLSFYELDNPTPQERNVIKNNHKVLFSSEETVNLFKSLGHKNVEYLPLYFDSDNFYPTNKKYFQDERIVFNISGKLERRKHHVKAIRSWIRKFGSNAKYSLQCAIYNGFLSPEQNQNLTHQMLEGKRVFNVNFLGFMGKNEIYNDFLNSSHVVLGVSGGEGWGLPEFQSAALGKHAVILNASGYKGWANDKNSILINPSGKISSVDNVFFKAGADFNQGDIYDFNEDDFISACEEAIKRVESGKKNKEGLKLQEEFSVTRFSDSILKTLN